MECHHQPSGIDSDYSRFAPPGLGQNLKGERRISECEPFERFILTDAAQWQALRKAKDQQPSEGRNKILLKELDRQDDD